MAGTSMHIARLRHELETDLAREYTHLNFYNVKVGKLNFTSNYH